MEAMNVTVSVCTQNLQQPPQPYMTLVKQTMIDDGRVPIKLVQLNSLIKDMSDGKTLPMSWNSRGRAEIMPL